MYTFIQMFEYFIKIFNVTMILYYQYCYIINVLKQIIVIKINNNNKQINLLCYCRY